MKITYELYRAKNDEKFKTDTVEYIIQNIDDLVIIDQIIQSVLTQEVSNIPEIAKYGTAYIGRMTIANVEITDNDNLGGMNEEQFRNYMKDPSVMPYLDIKWSKSIKDTKKK